MNRTIIGVCALGVFLITFVTATTSTAQMGLRENDLFAPRKFAKAGPVIGSPAPELDLKNLDGKSVTLKSYRGKVVVLVKGGYT